MSEKIKHRLFFSCRNCAIIGTDFEKKKWLRRESAQSFQNGGRHDRRRFFSFHGNFITFGCYRCCDSGCFICGRCGSSDR